MRSDSLIGFGKVPALTLRQSVGAENGNGVGRSGRFGLCTRCDSRIKALSGSVSNDGITDVAVGGGAVMGVETGELIALVLDDTVSLRLVGRL